MINEPLKVFIAEDEYLMRKLIREKIEWEKYGYIFAGEAAYGDVALEEIEEILPDVIIIDIEMPIISGLELCEKVNARFPWIKVIILTGHQEFEYARNAVQLGVKAFLLKPLKTLELISILKKLSKEIINEKLKTQELAKIKELEREYNRIVKDNFLHSITHIEQDEQYIIKTAQKFGLDFSEKYFCTAIMHIDNLSSSEIILIEDICKKVVDSYQNIFRFYSEADEIALIASANIEKCLESNLYLAVRSLKKAITTNLSKTSFTGIGGITDNCSGIIKSFNDAKILINYRFLYKKNFIINIKDVLEKSRIENELHFINKEELEGMLQYGNIDGISDFIEKYYNSRFVISTIEPHSILQIFMIDFLNKSDIFLKTLFNVSLDSISPDFTNLSSVNEKIKDFPQFTEQIKVFIAKIIEFRDEQRQLKHVFQLNLAKKYIKDSCHSHELNLESIAKVSGMSPAHFSTIFRQEVGITYIEYLTDIRIEEAKRLLSETRMRSSDIAYEVEYTDPQYFSYLFRKKTGMSPTEYRKTHTEEL